MTTGFEPTVCNQLRTHAELWALAYTYASNRGLPPHRVEQFADDYASCFAGHDPAEVLLPAYFEAVVGVYDVSHPRSTSDRTAA